MKIQHLASVLAVLVLCSAANASIIDGGLADDGTGGIVASSAFITIPPSIVVDANQYLRTGTLLGFATTDTETDPNIWSRNNVYNDTGFDWTDYHIQISMVKPAGFTILYVTTAQANWSATVSSGPTLYADGNWVATIDYVMQAGGSPVAVGSEGEFDYQMSFVGSINFLQVMTPTPEPATLALLGAGAAALVVRHRRKRA